MLEFSLLLFVLLLYGVFGVLSGVTTFIVVLALWWLPKYLFLNCFLEAFWGDIVVTRGRFRNDCFALTFDDVPDKANSFSEILDVLKEFKMTATFFVISDYANKSDADHVLLSRAVQEGHQLANHGRTNFPHVFQARPEITLEITHCDRLIESIYANARVPLPTTLYYRPGMGLFGSVILSVIRGRAKTTKIALGSVYPQDPTFPFVDLFVWYLKSHIEPGDVVILHDRKWTPRVLRKFLTWMKYARPGLKSVTLQEMFH